jgi:hypothetical protein
MTTRIIIILTVVVAGIFFVRDGLFLPKALCKNIACISLQNRQTYDLKEVYADTPDTYRALYQDSLSLLRLEVKKILPEQSDQELTGAVSRMKALFEKAPAPYPGEISDAVICDAAYIPTYKEANGIRYFTGFLNDRLTFGSCSKDQAVYTGMMGFVYCPKSSLLIKLELITQTADFPAREKELTERMTSMTCNE